MTKTKEQEEVPPTKTNEKKENNQISYRQDFKEYIGLEHLAEKRDVNLRRIEYLRHRMIQFEEQEKDEEEEDISFVPPTLLNIFENIRTNLEEVNTSIKEDGIKEDKIKAARESKVREEYERRYNEAKANFFVKTIVRGNHNDSESFWNKVKENKWNGSGEKRTILNEDTALSNKSPDMDPLYVIAN